MKKKLFMVAASAVVTVGVLAACGSDQEIEEPIFNEETNTEIEFDTEDFNQGNEMDEGIEETPALDNDEDEFQSEMDSYDAEDDYFEFDMDEDDTNDNEIQG